MRALHMTAINDTGHLLGRLRMRHLQLLALLGPEPNVARCAKRMHLTQPAASKLLREIEDILGTVLFARNRRGLSPTPAGCAMTRHAALIVEGVSAAHAELALTLRGATGHVRLGVFPVAIPELLARTREHLLVAWPHLVMSVREGVETSLLNALATGELDCVMGRVVTEALTPDLSHEALFHEPASIVCGAGHPVMRARKSERLAWLARCEWVLPTLGGASYNIVASRLAQEGVPAPRVTVETTSVPVVEALLNRSQMLSVLPQTLARSLALVGRVGIIPVPLPASLYPVGIMYRQQAMHGPMVKAVIEAARLAAAN
jgi:DNA-binding transcriptional LysR family regulator